MEQYDKCKEIIEYYSDRSSYATKAINGITEKLYKQTHSGYEELYEKIALLSDKEFADIIVKIVGAEYNIYDRFVMYTRMKNAIDLLAYGVCKEDVQKLIETQTDDIAVKLIVWRW